MLIPKLKVSLCIPTLNAGQHSPSLLSAINQQTLQPSQLLIIDSSSTDGSLDLFRVAGAKIHVISPSQFNHGGTRQLGVEMAPDAEIIVFLTQDAILADGNALKNLVACFDDDEVGAAYGRQLPRQGAGPIEVHARMFNYSSESQIRTMADVYSLGIKTAFISNSFAAYRRSALMGVGGFQRDTILGEDTCAAARMLLKGWKVAYCAEARVYHSHDYDFLEEFRRYFDTGVFHAREPWIRHNFGGAGGEGLRFVRSELQHLLRKEPKLIPSALGRTFVKYLGFGLGLREKYMPIWLKRALSMHKFFWDIPQDGPGKSNG